MNSVRKKCPRCGMHSHTNILADKYWGKISKVDGQLICYDCAINEMYDRMFKKSVDDEH